jgi:predicted GNAT family N-acyltransferase
MIHIERFAFKDEALRLKAFEIRTRVFVEEQHVDPKLEYDEFEETAHHYLVSNDGQAVGTARRRETNKGIKLERFAVLPEFRNKSTGAHLILFVLEDVIPLKKNIYLHSQTRAIPFYERYGFIKSGDPFYEAGIEHYFMAFDKIK